MELVTLLDGDKFVDRICVFLFARNNLLKQFVISSGSDVNELPTFNSKLLFKADFIRDFWLTISHKAFDLNN